jgi:hypothetical protein
MNEFSQIRPVQTANWKSAMRWLIAVMIVSFMGTLSGGYSYQKPLAAGGFEASLEVLGGAHRMFREGLDQPTLKIAIWSTDGRDHRITVSFQIENIFKKPLPSRYDVNIAVPADGNKIEKFIPFQAGVGYFNIRAKFQAGGTEAAGSVDLGVVHRPVPGLRPNSLFGSNTSELKLGEDLNLLQTIGMKVERAHFSPPVLSEDRNWPLTLPPGEPVALDFSKLDATWKETKAHELWVLPIVGYSLAGAGNTDCTLLAKQAGMYGPPGDVRRFISTWSTILRHYSEIRTYEFWNEPWIFGWTWASTAVQYRQLQKAWCANALQLNPNYLIVAGSSTMFVRDNIQPYPECWRGLLGGLTHHPYTRSVAEQSFRGGDNLRSIDDCVLTAHQMGLARVFLTEGGTNYQPAGSKKEDKAFNNLENASKIVQYYVTAALSGAFMGNAQWNIGYGPDWTRSNTAFAVMTHFLEDRVPLVDIWPREELLWGGIFANAKFATEEIKSLPRSSELTTRWKVGVPLEWSNDTTKVAVIWSLTGQSKTQLDHQGELVIPDATDLRAFDLTGCEIVPTAGKLVLPLTQVPMYITTDNLSVLAFQDRIAEGLIRHITPLNVSALSLFQPADHTQFLAVRVENQLSRPVKGTLTLRITQSQAESSVPFAIDAGRLAEVEVHWPGTPVAPDNRYMISLRAELDAEANAEFSTVIREQEIAVAQFAKRRVRFTGSPDDLNELTPVIVDSEKFENPDDSTRHLLNPNLKGSAGLRGSLPRIVARVATAYDDTNLYLIGAVSEDQFHCRAGDPMWIGQNGKKLPLPYRQGMPDGLEFVTYCGDVLQFSFGFRDRVPGIGRQPGDPWEWKGSFYDTDYSFVAHVSTKGDQLIRIWGPDGSRQDGYQAEAVPGIKPVPGGKVKITRDNSQKLTIYEVAIPRSELSLFNPLAGRCRFGFVLYNSEKGTGGSMNWSDAAGIFDYWQSSGSFPPTWAQRLPCETFFGIEQ